MRAIDKGLQTPIHQQLEAMILAQIASGALKAGDKVYSENSVAKQYEVSRTTVRSVYDRLVARGVLTRSAGKGTYVALPAMTENISLLVGFSEKMTASGIQPTTRVLSREVTQPTEEVANALRIDPASEVVEVRRLRLLGERPFVVQIAILPYPRFAGLLEYDLERGRMTDYLQAATRFNLARAEETITAVPAGPEEVALLDVPKAFPVLVVRGLTFDTDDLPVRYSIAWYHSSMVRLETAQQRERVTA
jgi:GntR family transcriptional regulator